MTLAGKKKWYNSLKYKLCGRGVFGPPSENICIFDLTRLDFLQFQPDLIRILGHK